MLWTSPDGKQVASGMSYHVTFLPTHVIWYRFY